MSWPNTWIVFGAKPMKSTVDLSIIILNFNTRDLLATCLAKVFASNLASFRIETTVCDNGSTDGSAEMVKQRFPQVALIASRRNLGFAAGNNPGIRRAQGRYVLLLNSDTEVSPGALVSMITFMDSHRTAGAATCKLVLADGSMDPACHRGFPTPWAAVSYFLGLEALLPKNRLFGQYHQGYKDLTAIHEVDVISGAFFMVRREVLGQVGLLDEDYFFYGEDMDWAFRIHEAGWKVMFNPQVTVIHRKKASGRAHADRARRIQTQLYFYQYNKLFYRKNYAGRYPRMLMNLLYLLFDLRILMLKKFSL